LGETPESALAREVREETGWHLRRIEAVIADWKWTHNGVVRRELDYLVEVSGDLKAPKLEPGKHDKFCWVSHGNIEGIRSKYDSANDELWNIIRRATRTRLTRSLRLEPISSSSAYALRRLYGRGLIALDSWAWRDEEIPTMAARYDRLWDTGRGYNWLVYRREASQLVIGYGGIARRRIAGTDHFVLQCAVSLNEQQFGSGEDIVKAILAFTRQELDADHVFAYASPPSQWARDIMARSNMRLVGAVESDERYAEVFMISLLENRPYDLDQEAVTGIGQILAVPS
jgi:RimJ/RimL family protein N-acetyltransferase